MSNKGSFDVRVSDDFIFENYIKTLISQIKIMSTKPYINDAILGTFY